MLTSLGYHTFTIRQRLDEYEYEELQEHLNFLKKAGIIHLRPMKDKNNKAIYGFWIIEYPKGGTGLSWFTTYNALLGEYPYSIKAKINPKILTGTKDYIAAATASYLDKVKEIFNLEAKRLSPVLDDFECYRLCRVDYCINFDVNELGLNCTAEQLIKLIKQGNIPTHFDEWTEYDVQSHRTKPCKDSFYLQSDSLTVNCYRKYKQLEKEFPDCPDLDKSKHIIRFEIQCEYAKVYSITKIIRNSIGIRNVLNEMLSDDYSEKMLTQYFNKVIRRGDYYPLEIARNMIINQNFKANKECRLIFALDLVNKLQGMANAKQSLQGKDLEDFRQSLRELADLNINPVTIPKHWGIRHIPNLLNAYYDYLAEQRNKAQSEPISNKNLTDYLKWELKNKK